MYSKCLEYVPIWYDENMITIYSKVLLYAHNVDIMIIIHMHIAHTSITKKNVN